VQKGQTLWRICTTYKVSVQDVAELNNIRNHSQIKAGDRLFIPGATKKLWVSTSAQTSGTSKKPVKPKPAPPAPVIQKNTGMFVWPLIGPVTKRFGIQGGLKYDGISIKGKPEAQVRASREGKVIFSSFLEGYGDTVIIQHDSQFVTVYANLGQILVRRDQKVTQKQVLGRLVKGPPKECLLNFQVRRNRKARNPLFYLPEAR
jgi:lipoprotein NlpD